MLGEAEEGKGRVKKMLGTVSDEEVETLRRKERKWGRLKQRL